MAWTLLGLSYLEFTKTSLNLGLCLLPNLRNFSATFLWQLFQPYLLSSLLGFWWHEYYIFCYSPIGPWGPIQFTFSLLKLKIFSVYFLSVVHTGYFLFFLSLILPLSLSLIFFYWAHKLRFLSPSIEFFILIAYFYQFRNFHLVLLYIVLFLCYDSLTLCFKCICNYWFTHFYDGFFKIIFIR